MDMLPENDALKYFSQENYEKALEIFLENLEEAKKNGDMERIAYNANLAGLCLYFLHHPRESFEYFEMAVEHTEGEEREKVKRNIEEVEKYVERIEEDIEELKHAIEKENDKKKRGIILSNLGILYYLIGQNSMAEERFMEAERIFKDDSDKIALGAIYSNFALIYDGLQRLDYLYRALDIFINEGHIKGQVDSYHSLAMHYLHNEEYEESYYFLKKEIKLLDRINDGEIKRRAYELAADVAMEIGKTDEALKFTELASGE